MAEDQQKLLEPGPESEADPERQESSRPRKKPRRRSRRRWIILIVLALLLAGGYRLWKYLSSYESTDDAQVDGHVNPISARISGYLTGVYVEDTQQVQQGQVLVDIDPRDYQVAVDQARAALAESRTQFHAQNPNVPITVVSTQTQIATTQQDILNAEAGVTAAEQTYQSALARLRESEANNVYAQADYRRYAALVAKDETSRESYDQRVAAAKAQEATVQSNRAAADAALKQVDQARARLAQAQEQHAQALTTAPDQTEIQKANVRNRQAGIQRSQAALDQALLNLSYTRILAPVSGVVGKKTAEVGMQVSPGQQLFAIVPLDDIWITANFKETQMKRMRAGQSVTIRVDALGRDYKGYIEDMPGASGARFSILPPENATGNYVKVVQRFPVRIRLNPGENSDHRLRVGMSVEPKVWLR